MTLTTTERIIRSVLLAPIEQDNRSIAKAVGIKEQEVKSIRTGQLHAEVLPKLSRIEPTAFKRRCTECIHYIQKKTRYIDVSEISLPKEETSPCSIGIPEAVYVRYARGCEAFTPILQKNNHD
jgi:hypothetical protein